ncbi:MAG: SPOR domain-containing protein [Hyphomicrobiales bacterium]|nr:SPOR domain-containing protein [Hyphomicrobiales bacterium]MDE2113929.1 SPOR domain-containing protein [Hyphomicrobiales bacterium]
MVDTAFNKGSVVNLDEFERRLRGATTSNDASDDPLADLARLVGNDDVQPAARANIFSQPARGLRSVSPGSAPARQQRIEPSLAPMAAAPEAVAQSQPAVNAPAMLTPAPELRGTQPEAQSAFERQLQELHMRTEAMRRAADEAGQAHAPEVTGETPVPEREYAPDHDYDRASYGATNNVAQMSEYITAQNARLDANEPESVAAPAASKSSRPMFVMAMIFAVGLFGLGVTFVTRNNHGSALAGVPLIKADNAPVRVSPPTANTPKPTDQGASILDSAAAQKVDAANKPASKVVASAEQPMDLGQLPPPNATAAAPAAANAPEAAPTAPNLDGFDFHKVKTVAVRPDGTLIGQPAAPATSGASAPVQPVMGLTPPVMPTAMTPDPAPLPVLAPVAEPAPVAPAPAPVVTQHAEATPLPPTAPRAKVTARAAKIPHHPAKAKPASESLDGSKPLQLAQVTHAENAQTAADAADAPAAEDAAKAGTYSVQLAAPGSEAEAKVVMQRLAGKYGAQLQGHHLSYHRASVNGHNIFRVRLQGLSHGSAVDVCVNLKKHGGSCFVARN